MPRKAARTRRSVTPAFLRAMGVLLVAMILGVGALAVTTATERSHTLDDLTSRTIPLRRDVSELYRTLADADATITTGFLTGAPDAAEQRQTFDSDVTRAITTVSVAASRAGGDDEAVRRLTGVSAQLTAYSELAARARANERVGLPLGVSYLQEASELMQRSILPQAQALGTVLDRRLHDEYRAVDQAPLLLVAVASLLALALVASWLALLTRTGKWTPELFGAAVLVLIVVACWLWTLTHSSDHLGAAERQSDVVVGALAPAQVAALQARSIESLTLAAPGDDSREPEFAARAQLLLRVGPTGAVVGGALGAAEHLVADRPEKPAVDQTVARGQAYLDAHTRLLSLMGQGRYDAAVDDVTGTVPTGTAETFVALEDSLKEVSQTFDAGSASELALARVPGALVPATVLAAILALLGVVGGIHRRLRHQFARWLPFEPKGQR